MNPIIASLLTDGAFVIDNSNFEYITTCPRAAFYHIALKRQSVEKRAALTFGGALHAGLEIFYREDNMFLPDTQPRAILAMEKYFSEQPPIPEDDFRSVMFARSVLKEYFTSHKIEPFSIISQSDGSKAVELPFAVPIGTINIEGDEIPIVWSGKCDVAIKWDGGVWVMDHKSTSIFGPTYFNQYYNSNQMIGYCWALQHMLDVPVHGALVNVLAVRRPTKTGKTIEFGRQRFEYPASRIQEWQENVMRIITSFFWLATHPASRPEDAFPMHTMWCIGKFGQCQYFDVCTLPSDSRATMLQTDLYEPVVWSPLKEQ